MQEYLATYGDEYSNERVDEAIAFLASGPPYDLTDTDSQKVAGDWLMEQGFEPHEAEMATTNQVKYISNDYLEVGDYGGAGIIGAANIRSLEGQDGAFKEQVGYGSETLWILDTPDNRELLEKLESDYHLIDDEAVSNVEMEWEDEAWENWLRSDLIRSIANEDVRDFAQDLPSTVPEDTLWQLYRASMEETNTYPVPENNGVHVDVKRIAPTFEEKLTKLYEFVTQDTDVDYRPNEMLPEDYYAG